MANIPSQDFKNDIGARTVTRLMLVFQLVALVTGFVLIFFLRLYFIALIIAFLSLVVFAGGLLWIYIRYRTSSYVNEKKNLDQHESDLLAKIDAHTTLIQKARQMREQLIRDEKIERENALKSYQDQYIQTGLANAGIADANISGIAPKLIEHLAANGLTTAAHINANISSLQGLDKATVSALLGWRNQILAQLDITKPRELPHEISNTIKKKYDPQHSDNNAEEQKAKENRKGVEKERTGLQQRREQLAGLTFVTYLRYSLDSRGVVAAMIGIATISSLLCLGGGATVSAIMAWIPRATSTPTQTLPPTSTSIVIITLTPTYTLPPTFTITTTITSTPARTATPTRTSTPVRTPAPISTSTSEGVPTNTPNPFIFPTIPPTANCDPSYPFVCIPPPPPILTCADIPFRYFIVKPPDPHNFDGDHNGLGCETP
jgi:ABC-type multidrug transport system fused ATPase/permease subunit